MPLVLNGTTGVQDNSGAFVAGTAVASTSGTSIDFTSIPSWVKRVTVLFNLVSTNGTSLIQVQLGTSGGVTTSGYLTQIGYISNSTPLNNRYTTGFVVENGPLAAASYSGVARFTLFGSNNWCGDSSLCFTDGTNNANFMGSGIVPLGGTLDRVRITTINGTDAFDGGSINIQYE